MSAHCDVCAGELSYDLRCGYCEQKARAEAAEARVAELEEAITDALADLTPGLSPYALLSDALKGTDLD